MNRTPSLPQGSEINQGHRRNQKDDSRTAGLIDFDTRTIAPSMDGSVVAQIDTRLENLIRDEPVIIPWAIESGSRAWGFPSPDSDYDCRFIYVRPLRHMTALFPKRDVIETPLDAVLDVGGWELSKALRLLLKGNAVILEWLTSPIIYRGNSDFQKAALALTHEVVNRSAMQHHYRRLALSMRARVAGENAQLPLKKLFYILRPLVALKWLDENPTARFPPMHFQTLLDGVELDEVLRGDIGMLVKAKAETRELGNGKVPPTIASFIDDGFKQFDGKAGRLGPPSASDVAMVEGFHQTWLHRLQPIS
ncbi:MAG: nucleotidyltransferase domain-containing protein [Pseudomonadota bacterium]